ncbi:MAG: hypothetical protein Q8O56_09445 [Solirubrobacteraceae bacterium]|nr:hypothetical protein [Solirubrobacteraceae bacterium]
MNGRTAAIAEIGEIADKLKAHEPFGSIRVINAEGELTTDQDGDSVLRLRLTLSDPPGEHATWSLDDVDALQQEAGRLVRQAGVELPYVVTELYPESPDPGEDSSDGDVDELSRALESDDPRPCAIRSVPIA